MSRRGNCWDNAVVESFFSSLKKERIKKRIYKNRKIAIADISNYIELFYNPSPLQKIGRDDRRALTDSQVSGFYSAASCP